LASSGDWLAIPLFTAGISQRVPHKYRLLYLRIIYVTWFIFLKRRGLISMLTLAQLFLCHPLIVFCCDVLFFFCCYFSAQECTQTHAREFQLASLSFFAAWRIEQFPTGRRPSSALSLSSSIPFVVRTAPVSVGSRTHRSKW
jgi:hypothetical protein